MAQAPQFDAGQIPLAVSYDVLTPELDPRPRLIDGSNCLVTANGKLIKRPGTLQVANSGLDYRVDRCVVCESLDTPSVIYLLASAYNGATWTAYYLRLDAGGTPAWTTLGTLRDVNASTRPHEFVVSRGRVYVKGFPASGSSEKLGTVLFDPNAGSPFVTFWGILGPTTPVALTSAAGWSASGSSVTVNVGWAYTYAYKTRSGAVSNRAPLQTNPSLAASVTAPFTNKRPAMTVTGLADTTNVPTICIYRTTDGGGTFFKLKEISNTGAGNISFSDQYLESGAGGGTFTDPMPDQYLDTTAVAPTLTSNTPPITVLAESGTVGVTTPQASTPIESYAARLWYGIGNVLFFSGLEELSEGVPEDAWPSGLFGNFFRFQHPIVSLKATTEALYVFTTEKTYWVRGTTRDSLQALPLYDDLGAKRGHPRAVTAADTSVLFLTHDLRVCLARGKQRDFLSDPLGPALKDVVAAGHEILFGRYAELDKDWLVVASTKSSDTTANRQWVFDFNQSERGLWSVPWAMRVTACLPGQLYDTSDTARKLAWFSWNGTNGGLVTTDMTLTTVQDYLWGVGAGNYACSARFALAPNPTGNHLNALRAPAQTSVVYAVKADRKAFSSDTDPTLEYYLDNIGSSGTSAGSAVDPPRRTASVGYDTLQWPINVAAERIGLKLAKTAANERFELLGLSVIWTPGAGA
jgi:hypothetical protein